jgi:CMP-N-acetylneuraminic acid synthetase
LLEENSCLYIFRRADLLRRRNRIGENPRLFELDAREAWDIDEEIDFQFAEFLFRSRQTRAAP